MPLVSGPVARPVADGATTAMLEQLTFDTTFLIVGGADAGYTEYEFDYAETKKAAFGSTQRKIIGAVSLIFMIPTLILFVAAQRHLVRGIAFSDLKN
jgi:ABC-type glycerol-3-phosphate transport system permease component